jgi:hypothetical protein
VWRADCLHCNGGHILSNWAPFSGNSPTGGIDVTCGCVISDLGVEVLFEGELYVELRHEHWGDGCSSSSSCSSNDCERVWVPRNSLDQWWSAKGYGEGIGQGALCLGVDTACKDGRVAG